MSLTRRGLIAAPLLAPLPWRNPRPPPCWSLYAPGGASDVVGRILIEGLAQRLGGEP